MLNRFTFINILLAIFLLFLARQTLRLWSQTPKEVTNSPTRKAPEKFSQPALERKVKPSKDSFQTISEKNLFHPQRKWGKGVKKEGQRKSLFPKKTGAKEIILYGILIFDDHKIAVLGEGKVSRRNKRTKKVSVGDSFAGFQVVEISTDRVILRNEGETETVLLYKPKADRRIRPSPSIIRPPISPPYPPRVPKKPKSSPKKTLPEIFKGALEK